MSPQNTQDINAQKKKRHERQESDDAYNPDGPDGVGVQFFTMLESSANPEP
jgi:hypothetical protein